MVYTQHLLLGLIAEDRDPQGFLGSGITIDKARGAVWSIWDEANSDSNLSKQQEESGPQACRFPTVRSGSSKLPLQYSRTLDCQYKLRSILLSDYSPLMTVAPEESSRGSSNCDSYKR